MPRRRAPSGSCGSRSPRRARRGSRTRRSSRARLGRLLEWQAARALRELLALLRREPGAEELLDVGEVRLPRLLDLLHAGLREHGVRDARIGVAALLGNEPAGLEPVEQARDPRRGEQDRAGEFDPPWPAALRVVELHEHVEVAQRELVHRLEARRELPRERRVRAQEADPGGVGETGFCPRNFLWTQYLTRQAFLAMILAISSIAYSPREANTS